MSIATLAAGIAHAGDRPELAAPPAWVLPAPATGTLPTDSAAPMQILLNDQQIRITPEAVETYVSSRLRIQSAEGLQALSTFTFAWKPDADVLTIHAVKVAHAGQTRDLLDNGDSLTILRREDQLEQSVLTGTLTAVLQPPGLQVGDVIELSYTLRHKDPVVADKPDGLYGWPNMPVAHARLRVSWPTTLPMHWRPSTLLGAAQPVDHDGWRELTYEADALSPPLQPKGAPARFLAVRTLEVSSYDSWAQVAQKMAPLYTKAATLEAGSPLHAEVARIKQQYKSPQDRASAALRLVQTEVRYVLLAMNDGGLVPASADETWRRRFGDCKAKTVLLMALLRELGIDAAPAAVSTELGDGLEARLPAIDLFNHVMVRAVIDGKVYWLDGTRAGDRSVTRVEVPEFHWALPLVARGADLIALERKPYVEPQMLRSIEIDARDGIELPAPFVAKFVTRGDMAYGLKVTWDAVPQANREEGLRAFWRKEYPGVEVEKTDVHFDEETGELTWTARGTMRLEWDPKYRTYEPDGFGFGYRADFTRPKGTDAQAPYAVEFPVFARTVASIRLPTQTKPFTVLGTNIDATIAGTQYKRSARIESDRFYAEADLRSVAGEFPAAETAEAQRKLLEMSRNTLYLKEPDYYLRTEKELAGEVGKPLDSAQSYQNRAWEFAARGMLAPAVADYDAALQRDAKLETAYVGRAGCLLVQGKYDLAKADLKAALDLNAGNSDARRRLSLFAANEGRTREAIDLITPVVDKEHRASDLVKRGQFLLLSGDTEAAAKDIDAAIERDAKLVEAYFVKAEVLRRTDRRAEIPAVANALQKAHEGSPAATSLAIQLLLVFDERERAQALMDADLRKVASGEMLVRRAELLDRKSDVLARIAEARKLQPNSNALETLIVDLLLRKGWNAEALDAVAKLETIRGVTSQSLNYRGISYWREGKFSEASSAFAEARSKATDAGPLNGLCWDKALFGVALDEALKDCDAALARRPECGACMDSRAFTLLRMGKWSESVAAYDATLRMRPLEPASLYGHGLARLGTGANGEGKRDIDDARLFGPGVDYEFRSHGLATP